MRVPLFAALFFCCNSFGQLIREDNPTLDKTLIYCYDNIGNITSVNTYAYTTGEVEEDTATATEAYTYDATKKDRLTRVEDYFVSHDAAGNITAWRGCRYSWSSGKLAAISSGSSNQASLYTNCLFTYDGYGRRTKKDYSYDTNPLNSGAYGYRNISTYTYDHSGRLIREYDEDQFTYSPGLSPNTREFIFLYDGDEIIGVMHSYNGATRVPYYYRKNLQGDVTGIYDQSGTMIGEYTYDAYGNCSITYGINTDVVRNNPIRYRSYYFDRETSIYYLNSRYYDPALRRFLSLDSTEYLDPETPNGLNLYAYCNNDPVNYADPSGHSLIGFFIALGTLFVVGGVIGGVVSNYAEQNSGEEFSVWKKLSYVTVGAFAGLALGGAILSIMGVGSSVVFYLTTGKALKSAMIGSACAYQIAALGGVALDIGGFVMSVFSQTPFEMAEWIGKYNTNQPIIK